MIHSGSVKRKGLVSVVVPTYNSSPFLKESIDSALSQSYTEKEIIVVDDGSTDNTMNILQPYGSTDLVTPRIFDIQNTLGIQLFQARKHALRTQLDTLDFRADRNLR